MPFSSSRQIWQLSMHKFPIFMVYVYALLVNQGKFYWKSCCVFRNSNDLGKLYLHMLPTHRWTHQNLLFQINRVTSQAFPTIRQIFFLHLRMIRDILHSTGVFRGIFIIHHYLWHIFHFWLSHNYGWMPLRFFYNSCARKNPLGVQTYLTLKNYSKTQWFFIDSIFKSAFCVLLNDPPEFLTLILSLLFTLIHS